MNHSKIIREYLRERRGEELVADSYPFVTISREAGAGGHTLAREILRKLEHELSGEAAEGWEVFDQKLCAIIAEDEKLGVSFDQLVTEEYRSEISAAVSEMLAQRARRLETYRRVFEIIRILGTLGKCVIVGRAGMCVTSDMPLGLHIRLIAPESVRVKRMMKLLDVGEDEARRVMHQQDQDRHRLVKDFFGKNADDPFLYDAVFNTGRLPISEVAEVVARLIKQKFDRLKSGSRSNATR